MPTNDNKTAAFRTSYRKEFIGPRYSGAMHFWFTTLSCVVVITTCLLLIREPNWKEWLIVPIGFLYINLAEYLGHKGPMHHRKEALSKVFERHTLQHHRFFTDTEFSFDQPEDAKAVLFPPVLLLFFFFAFALPAATVFYFLWSANAALIFMATIIAYYLNYEWLHYAYHLPDSHWVSGLPFIKQLRRLHHAHHNPKLMAKYNFNITYPIFDFLFGTLYREEKSTVR